MNISSFRPAFGAIYNQELGPFLNNGAEQVTVNGQVSDAYFTNTKGGHLNKAKELASDPISFQSWFSKQNRISDLDGIYQEDMGTVPVLNEVYA